MLLLVPTLISRVFSWFVESWFKVLVGVGVGAIGLVLGRFGHIQGWLKIYEFISCFGHVLVYGLMLN